jgi:hypothetical protein
MFTYGHPHVHDVSHANVELFAQYLRNNDHWCTVIIYADVKFEQLKYRSFLRDTIRCFEIVATKELFGRGCSGRWIGGASTPPPPHDL